MYNMKFLEWNILFITIGDERTATEMFTVNNSVLFNVYLTFLAANNGRCELFSNNLDRIWQK